MKNTIQKIIMGLVVLGFSNFIAAKTTVISINGMVCAFCAQGIEKGLSKLPQTKDVFVDLKNKVVAVEVKDGMTLDKKAILSEISDAGYDVTKIEETTHTLAEIKTSVAATGSAGLGTGVKGTK